MAAPTFADLVNVTVRVEDQPLPPVADDDPELVAMRAECVTALAAACLGVRPAELDARYWQRGRRSRKRRQAIEKARALRLNRQSVCWMLATENARLLVQCKREFERLMESFYFTTPGFSGVLEV